MDFNLNLAREFSCLNWRFALASISSSDVMEWQRYFSCHHFNYERANINAAMIASTNWNVTASSAGIKLDSAMSISDFLPMSSFKYTDKYKDDDELINAGISMGALRIEPDL